MNVTSALVAVEATDLKDVRTQFKSLTTRDGVLVETFKSFDEVSLKQFWLSMSGHVVTATISYTAASSFDSAQTSSHSADDAKAVLLISLDCAMATLCRSGIVVPLPLFETALLLHGFIMTVEDAELRERVSLLCEYWWSSDIEGKNSLISTPLIHLMDVCLTKKRVPQKFIKRLWKMKDSLLHVCASDEAVWDRVLNLFSTPRFININQGEKFLSHILSTQSSLISRAHSVIKYQLTQMLRTTDSSSLLAEKYSSMLFNAWSNAVDDNIRDILADVIQDFTHCFIHLKRGGTRSLHNVLYTLLRRLHLKRSDKSSFSDMLARQYQPFLWRSLKAANSEVRANAAMVFFDLFPLVNTERSKAECGQSLQMQFDALFTLLEDANPTVRQISVQGTFHVLLNYWDQIPNEVSSDIINTLLTKLAWDQASADVRVAVIQGLMILLDNHDTYTELSSMLPKLADLFHDKVEKVRLAFVKLLHKVKHIRAFKIWRIISKEHLFARLEVDTPAVCVKLVELVHKSFLDESIDNQVKLDRCMDLIDSGLERARKFYRYAVTHINVQQAVSYMLLLRKCIVTCVNRHKRDAKENRRPSLCTTLANITLAAANRHKGSVADQTLSHINSNFSLIDNNLTEFTLKDKESASDGIATEELSVSNIELMRGLLEVICILWTGFSRELSQPGNDEINDILCDKFGRSLPLLFNTFEDEGIQLCLVHFAGFLPEVRASVLYETAEERLRGLAMSPLSNSECTSLITCLAQSGHMHRVLYHVVAWLSDMTNSNPRREKSQVTSDSGQCLHVAEDNLKAVVQVLSCLLTHPLYKQKIIEQHESTVQDILDKLLSIQRNIVRSLYGRSSVPHIPDGLVEQLFNLSFIISCMLKDSHQSRSVSQIVMDACSTVNHSCVKHLGPDNHTINEAKRARRLLDLQSQTLMGADDSQSINSSSEAHVKLATRLAAVSLQILTNYIVIFTPDTEQFCNKFTKLYSNTEHLCHEPDNGLDVTLCELLKQLSITAVTENKAELVECFRACFSYFFHHCLIHINDRTTSCTKECHECVIYVPYPSDSIIISKLLLNHYTIMNSHDMFKSVWTSLLQTLDLHQDETLHQTTNLICQLLLSVMEESELSPSAVFYVKRIFTASQLVAQFLQQILQQMLQAGEASSDGKLSSLHLDNIKQLLSYTDTSC